MLSNFAIKVENLGKSYQIYDSPQDRLWQMLLRGRKQFYREFWALKDVSFEVKKGETFGIVGRNGSGKSTLLQMICGTLNPTTGTIQTNGRIAALLELGSGFNPEFTGRENVYLNGTVLGLSQKEIDERFDQIAAFADIGDFIEQPIKTYSSGMAVRLAFAVIAHVDADILVIDEALAVGDAVFTQKCMRFLRNFIKKGTVFFVSHDTGSVLNLCKKAIWLSQGRVHQIGDTKEVIELYTQFINQEIYGDKIQLHHIPEKKQIEDTSINQEEFIDKETSATFFNQLNESSGWQTGKAEILSVNLLNKDDTYASTLHGGELVKLEITAKANARIFSPILGWFVKDRLGQSLFGEHTFTYIEAPLEVDHDEKVKAVFQFYLPLLPNGEYSITVSIAEGTPEEPIQHHWLHDALVIKVLSEKLRYGLVGIPFKEVKMEILK